MDAKRITYWNSYIIQFSSRKIFYNKSMSHWRIPDVLENYEVLELLNIHYGIDGQALKSPHHILFSIAIHKHRRWNQPFQGIIIIKLVEWWWLMTGSDCDVAWREVLQTSDEVELQLLNIHYGMDGLNLKRSYHTLFSIQSHQSWNQPFQGLKGVEWWWRVVWAGSVWHCEKWCTLLECCLSGSPFTILHGWTILSFEKQGTAIHCSVLPLTRTIASELKSTIWAARECNGEKNQ